MRAPRQTEKRPSGSVATGPRYRFGFAMTTSSGNAVVVENLRKYTRGDPEVEATWAPVSHWIDPDPYRWMPGPFHRQAVMNVETSDLLEKWSSLDAVVVHAFQLFAYLATFKRHGRGGPLLVLNQDYAPVGDRAVLQALGKQVRPAGRCNARLAIERFYARRADLVVPRAEWAARMFVDGCGVPQDRVVLVRHGVDLQVWRPPDSRPQHRRPRLLFVGSRFAPKGGPLLLDVFRTRFAHRAELHLMTGQPPTDLPSGVIVHGAEPPNSQALRDIYWSCDVAVLPTRADNSPLALMEAMACGLPVVSTLVGGVPEIVDEGRSGFLVPPDDGRALGDAIDALIARPELAARMGAVGRARAESLFSAQENAERLLAVLKTAVEARRGGGCPT